VYIRFILVGVLTGLLAVQLTQRPLLTGITEEKGGGSDIEEETRGSTLVI
jgi:hypothetical protein